MESYRRGIYDDISGGGRLVRSVSMTTPDSHRADRRRYPGYEQDTVATIDALTKEGLAIENTVASSASTVISMASLHTGEPQLARRQVRFTGERRRGVLRMRTAAELPSASSCEIGAGTTNAQSSSFFGFDESFDWFEDFPGNEQRADQIEDRVSQQTVHEASPW